MRYLRCERLAVTRAIASAYARSSGSSAATIAWSAALFFSGMPGGTIGSNSISAK
jgi:hypothetical protein